MTYTKKFSIEKGKITTLSLFSIRDKIKDILDRHIKREFCIHKSHNRHLYKKNKKKFNLTLRLFLPFDDVIHDPVSQVFIRMISLSAVNKNGDSIMLNDQETEFELLSLRGGAVALMGSNAIDAGEYKYFELELNNEHRVVVNNDTYPLTIEDWAFKTLRFDGPFDLRGGRVTEVMLHFDPNASLFYIRDRGYIIEPDIRVASIISLSPVQELRLVQASGAYSNVVMSKTELAFQGLVTSVNPLLADNII